MTTSPDESAAFERAARPTIDALNGGGIEVVTGDLSESLPCSKCGYPLPPLPPELQKVVDQGIPVELAHEAGGCPTDVKAPPSGRYFELRVDIVEVIEVESTAVGFDTETEVRTEELMSFIVGHRAPRLTDAMRPLALAFGEKWTQAEKNAGMADTPVADDEAGS
jgi:hypothetical protein